MSMIKILAVEDNRAITDFYFEFFTEFGYDIQISEDAEDAIAKQREFHADLIILDLDIPGGGGLYVYETLRKKLGDNVPIIFSTGKPEQLGGLKGLSNASSLGKPTPPERLMSEVKRLTERVSNIPKPHSGFAPPPPPPESEK